MKLWAIADLHIGHARNRMLLESLGSYPDDWLIVAGDASDTPAQLHAALTALTARFARVVWVPGNHELWTSRQLPEDQRGQAHNDRLVALCRRLGVLTPEDPFPVWPGDGPPRLVVPMFLLYDYSFGPPGLDATSAVAWAEAAGLRSADEDLLSPVPFASRSAWCHHRIASTRARLETLPSTHRLILVNHFPLRQDLAVLPRIPRFRIWCGTRLTDEWHRRFPVETVVYGHLHLRQSRVIDGVGFEEVSLGYPHQWADGRTLDSYLRRIL